MLRLDRGSLAAIFCAAKEKMRYALNGLLVNETETVATDGRKLIRVRHPGGEKVELAPKILVRESVLGSLKMLSRKASDPESMKTIDVDVEQSNENGKFHTIQPLPGGGIMNVPMPVIEGTFPVVNDVVPHKDGYCASVTFDGSLFEDILKTIAEVNKARGVETGEAKRITLKLYSSGGATDRNCSVRPMRIESRNGDVTAILMPISVD